MSRRSGWTALSALYQLGLFQLPTYRSDLHRPPGKHRGGQRAWGWISIGYLSLRGAASLPLSAGLLSAGLFSAWLFSAEVYAAGSEPDHDSMTNAQQAFSTCTAKLRDQAISQGLSRAAIDEVFTAVELIPRAISADRKQAEFTQTFSDYYNKRVTPTRVTLGRKLYTQHRQLLAKVELSTGVPAQYLLALWGLETNFGNYLGKLSIPSALATLACDSRRGEFFTRELMAVIQVVAREEISAASLVGSWAGAMGHVQFMPTTWLEYAVDGDNDGRRDLYGSLDDALHSAANYLQNLGWEPGFRWGREVVLPKGFDYALTGSDQWQMLSYWHDLGVNDVFGKPLPSLPAKAAILLPMGHQGPAFVVYENFRTIMQWNRSESYALSVGCLADRIAGAGRLSQALPTQQQSALPRAALINLQQALIARGYTPGKPDGILGPATRKAIRAFQQASNLVADGYPNQEVFANLQSGES